MVRVRSNAAVSGFSPLDRVVIRQHLGDIKCNTTSHIYIAKTAKR